MKLSTSLLILIFFSNLIFAQQSFIKELSPMDSLYLQTVKTTDDGGWIAAGGNFVSKFSPCGDIEWSNQYFLDGRISSTVITVDSSANILLYGDMDIDSTSQSEMVRFLMKLDEVGNVLWCKHIQLGIGVNPPFFIRRKLEIASDGDYFLSGEIFYSSNQSQDYFVMKLDTDGNLKWSNVYDFFYDFVRIGSTSNSGLIIFGNISGYPQVTRHILKLDMDGNIEWERGIGPGVFTSDVEETDDGYLCVGSMIVTKTDTIPTTAGSVITNSITQNNCFTYKLDFEGNLLWTGEVLHEPRCFNASIVTLDNGNSYLSTTSTIYNNPESFRTEITPNGNVVEQRVHDSYHVSSMDLFDDKSMIFTNGNRLLKTDNLKRLSCEDSISFPPNIIDEIVSIPSSSASLYELEVNFLPLQVYTVEKGFELENICETYPFDTQIDTSICQGELLEFNVDFYGAMRFTWQDGSSDSYIKITEPGIYEVEIVSCNSIITKSFNVMDSRCDCANFPNVFTPDGDGINDSFGPIYGCETKNSTFKIYNRWGELVFSSIDKEAKWDGSLRGKPATSDLYVYFFSYENELGKMILEKGDITLLR